MKYIQSKALLLCFFVTAALIEAQGAAHEQPEEKIAGNLIVQSQTVNLSKTNRIDNDERRRFNSDSDAEEFCKKMINGRPDLITQYNVKWKASKEDIPGLCCNCGSCISLALYRKSSAFMKGLSAVSSGAVAALSVASISSSKQFNIIVLTLSIVAVTATAIDISWFQNSLNYYQSNKLPLSDFVDSIAERFIALGHVENGDDISKINTVLPGILQKLAGHDQDQEQI